MEEFRGLNQQSRRASIDDQEEWWNENLFAIDKGNLRSCWGPSDPIYTAPTGTTILRIFFGYYGNDTPLFGQPPPGRKGFMMLSDGTADEVDLDPPHQVRHIGQCWQPISPKWWCSVKVWRPRWVGSQLGEVGGVVIGSPAGLFAWDGTTLWVPGGPAPLWLTNADTNPFPGLTVMPEPADLPGIYAMEVYENRLWVTGKDVIAFSMPGNGADFTTTDGGGFVAYFGDKLVHDYMDLAATSGYLFAFGDSSIDVINNVQMIGGSGASPAVTNFNYYNVDPQVGQRFPRPVGHWGRYFTMYNGAGLFLMQGGDATEIGQKTLNVYNTLDSSEFYPTMCPATMYGMRVMLFNMMVTDPFGVKRSLMLMWHGTFWSVASQWYDWLGGAALSTPLKITNIASYEDNSVITPYGTDGTNLFRLFDHPDKKLPKRLSTKFYSGSGAAKLKIKNFKRLFLEVHDNTGFGVSVTGTMTTRGGGVPTGTQDVAFELAGGTGPQVDPNSGAVDTIGRYGIEPWPVSGMGLQAAIDLNSFSPDFTLERLHIMNEDRTLFGA